MVFIENYCIFLRFIGNMGLIIGYWQIILYIGILDSLSGSFANLSFSGHDAPG